MATGNHFWLDVVAGIVLAVVALAIVYRARFKRVIARLL
jgi:membrane-associated phospholipid phosphatase